MKDSIEKSFAFFSEKEDAADALDVTEDFARLGVDGSKWRFCSVNSSYELSPTYPKKFVVPAKISDSVIFHAAKFRSKCRLPVLSYIHNSTKASITRCSQPMVGIKQKRSIQDEKLIEAIFQSNDENLEKVHLIIDARPSMNAMANQALGAGTESLDNYKNCERKFMNIENIHVMRKSLGKFVEAIQSPDHGIDKFYDLIDRSGWLKHIKYLMEANDIIIEYILAGKNVLVHCSDGWDRTAQLTSLAELCLDPFYRTIKGFQILIEKEWISFGHKFNDRCGHDCIKIYTPNSAKEKMKRGKSKEVAPIFHQFLECTFQLISQFPHEFEFNIKYLVELFDNVYSCQFGTFLLNNEKQRIDCDLRGRTNSLWSNLDKRRAGFLNENYSQTLVILRPKVHPSHLKLWKELYLRHEDFQQKQ